MSEPQDTLDDLWLAYQHAVRENSALWMAQWRRRIEAAIEAEAVTRWLTSEDAKRRLAGVIPKALIDAGVLHHGWKEGGPPWPTSAPSSWGQPVAAAILAALGADE